MEEIKHFDHRHPLSLSNRKRDDWIKCEACRDYCDGQTYICSQGCEYYALHESCAKLPEEVKSPFHPHPLALQRADSRYWHCHGCHKYHELGQDFVYLCEDCNVKFDVKCAFMGTVKVIEGGKEKEQLHTHPLHHHPLVLFEKVPDERYKCSVCVKYCSDPCHPTYGCWECRLFLHDGSCFEAKLPLEIQHFFHPHPLTLCTKELDPDITCRACYMKAWKIWYYSCKQCKVSRNSVLDIACALLPTTMPINDIKSESQIQHFLHGHPLSLCNNKDFDDKKVSCLACAKGCTGNTTYVCGRGGNCERIYFHKSCLELPQQICHPFHLYHPLRLTLQFGFNYRKCNACRKVPHGFTTTLFDRIFITYICEAHCEFSLHVECVVMMPSITYEGHSHLLQFKYDNVENLDLKCSACNSNISESKAFTCLYCDLNLHFLCGPLPYTIKHKDHIIHPLFLTNSPVEEEVEDETDEFYCHACEEERDPLLPVYYCAECYFVAEFKCIFPQIISSLKGEYGDIELRNTLGHPGSSWQDMYEELKNLSKAMKTITTEEDGQYKDSEYSEDFLLSDKAYTRFMKFLDSGKWIFDPWKIIFNREEFVSVGDYVVPLRLATIQRKLLSKHGDVSAKSTLSPMAKLYLFIVLCECIYSMTSTKVVDITKDLLLNWWASFKMLQFARFEIQFAFDHLKRLTRAYFGLYVKRRVDNAFDNIDRDLTRLNKDIEALEKKRECIKSAKSAKSIKIEECLREASILKHGIASTGVLRILP
nr:hypothetical protein CFP56_29295 [Quercus suber]